MDFDIWLATERGVTLDVFDVSRRLELRAEWRAWLNERGLASEPLTPVRDDDQDEDEDEVDTLLAEETMPETAKG